MPEWPWPSFHQIREQQHADAAKAHADAQAAKADESEPDEPKKAASSKPARRHASADKGDE